MRNFICGKKCKWCGKPSDGEKIDGDFVCRECYIEYFASKYKMLGGDKK
jgi:hypothetical protein